MTKDELLEKLLDQSLTKEELVLLEKYQQDDLVFKNETLLYQSIINGIKLNGKNNIKAEINAVININEIAFENNLKKALELKNRHQIKDEINKALKGESQKQTRIIQLIPAKLLAIAASILFLVVAGWFLFKNNEPTFNPIFVNLINEKYKIHLSTIGLIDKDKEYKEHMSQIFSSLSNLEFKEAQNKNELFFKNNLNDYRYYRIKGLIYTQQKEFKRAISSLQEAILMGDGCISKILLASVYGNQSKQSVKLISEIKLDKSCIQDDNLWIEAALNEFK